jgi:hypothetical protein
MSMTIHSEQAFLLVEIKQLHLIGVVSKVTMTFLHIGRRKKFPRFHVMFMDGFC